MAPGEQLVNKTATVELSERWLEARERCDVRFTDASGRTFACALEPQHEGPHRDRDRRWDSRLTGLGVIVGRRRVSFVVQRRVDGEQRLVTLGHWAPGKLRQLDPGLRDRTLTVLQARGKAIEYLGQMRGGDDPRGEDAPQAQPVSPTLAAATELHLSRMRKEGASPRGIETLEDEIERHLGDWKLRRLHEITRTECRERHDKITKVGPYVANRVMRHLRAIWNTALKEADLPANPTIAVHWNTEERRQEPIPWPKLPAWRKALDGLSEVRRDYNLVVLLTGIRRMDAATIRREHVDLGELTLHRPNPKGGKERAFTIPISAECAKIFKRRLRDNMKDDGWVFPTDSVKDRACVTCRGLGLPDHKAGTRTHLSEPKEADEALVSPHRLRDTYTTALAALDPPVSPYVIDVLTNHRPPRGTVTAGYVDLTADDLRSAQDRVTDFLLAKMNPPKKTRRKPRRRS
jgi:integrase